MIGKEGALMARAIIAAMICVALIGCGASKQFVNDEVTNSEKRIASRLDEIAGKTDNNSQELTKLQNLSLELSKKTDMAINKASGFEDYQVIWEGNVTFGFDKADLDGVAQEILSTAANKMAENKQSIIEITGHTDATGPATYNYQLGDRRANASRRFLAEKYSIPLYRMFILSFGKDKPVSAPDIRGGNAKNRRVSLRIWAPVVK